MAMNMSCAVLLLVIIVAFLPSSLVGAKFPLKAADPTCVQEGSTGQCDFYQCYESIANCGPNGYLINYGYKFCQAFYPTISDFDTTGQNWVQCVRECLTGKLLPYYTQGITDCTTIENYAFQTHVECYTTCGFCEMLDLRNVYGLIMTYKADLSAFFTCQGIKQVCGVMENCTQNDYYAQMVIKALCYIC